MSKTLVVPTANGLPAHLQADTPTGNENISASDLAIPYISLLQSLSKPCVKGNAEYVKGAEPGMFYNTVSKELSSEFTCANMFVKTVYVCNKKKELGEDYQGEHTSEDEAIAHLESQGLNPNDYAVTETAKHMLAIIDPDTGKLKTAAVMSLRSSGLKTSRNWNTQILANYPNADRFAGIWKVTAIMQSNRKGQWFTPNVELIGYAGEELYAELQEKYQQWHDA